jgi:hypothetical protein
VANESTPSPQHILSVFRGNAGLSNSGFWIARSTSNAVVEGSSFAQSNKCVTIDPEFTDLIFEADSTCSSGPVEGMEEQRTILRGPRLA